MARYFSTKGATVILVSRSKEKLEAVQKDLKSPSYIFPTDLSVLENVKSIFAFCKEQGLKLDGIVHCAGLTLNLPLRGNDIETMDNLFRVNTGALAEILKFASKKFIQMTEHRL